MPYGCSQGGRGLNFSICIPKASSVWLELKVPVGAGRQMVLTKLDRDDNTTGPIWHVEVALNVPNTGICYSWLIDPELGTGNQPAASAKRVLDPHARALDSGVAEMWNDRTGPAFAPSAMVPNFSALDRFNWEGVQAPGLELKDLIIYEAHVRGFTKDPSSGVRKANAGTFLGFIEKIPHLVKLGINCVELLPIFEFDETCCPLKHATTGEDLQNYWGYQTCAYYAPMQRFVARGSREMGAAIVEFKTLVRELHRAGIEVVLDVVFNHTGEGSWGVSNWHSMSAIAESEYYLMIEGNHCNFTGCGNTVNSNNPMCTEWIIECLRYWALEMRVDGFRFDLASSMTRGPDGQIQEDPLFVRRLVHDPLLQHIKLIAEPWDCAWPDGYLVGIFPQGKPAKGEEPRWAEWNGKFRDVARQFIKGDEGMKGQFATRICGSSDLYEADGRAPKHSINFISAHDGFTLHDLVSYNKKHNQDNSEQSGEDSNISWNCGLEGATKDPEILELRRKQMKNFTAALFLSAGTPMFSAGDEYGRTQKGNNNTWCQDAANWFSWEACAKEEDRLLRFWRLMISFRKHHQVVLNRNSFYSEQEIAWNHDDWDDQYNYLSFVLHLVERQAPSQLTSQLTSRQTTPADSLVGGSEASTEPEPVLPPRRAAILVAFNAGHIAHPCKLPPGREWRRIVDTNLEAPLDFADCDEDAQPISGEDYLMAPYSCLVLKDYEDPEDGFEYESSVSSSDLAQMTEHLRNVVSRDIREELKPEMKAEGQIQWQDKPHYGA